MPRWRKLGFVHGPAAERAWQRTHAHLPTPLVLGDRIRVFFAGLDASKFGRAGFVDVALDDPTTVLDAPDAVVLDLGEPGTFDDCGVVPSCALRAGGKTLLYYVGFQRAQRTPYMLYSGLAESTDDGRSFRRVAAVPVLDRTAAEPFSRGAPFVVPDGGGYRMWYWSCLRWLPQGASFHYNNVLRTTASSDPLRWTGATSLVLEPTEREFSLGRPWVAQLEGKHRMWYTVRSRERRDFIGYAESADGEHWERRDDAAGIGVSDSGWDSEMVCYAALARAGERLFLFYNGNNHGATGFGVAELDEL